MAKQRKHSSSKVSNFFDYLGGKLSGRERNAFERRLQKDPFEAEAAEGLGMVTRAEMEEDLHAAFSKIRRRIRRRRRIAWYSTAAAVASLMIVATIFFNVDDGSMDRYKTAPEFEKAVQEQPSAPGVEKKRTRKDAIPEAEELQEGLMMDEDRVQEEKLMLDEDRVQEELSQEEFNEKMAEALVTGVAKDVTDRQVAAEDKMNIMEVTDDEYIATDRNENVAAAAEMNSGENAAGKKAISEKAAGERSPEEISASGERPPEEVRDDREVRAEGAMVEDEIVFVERAADVTDSSKPAAQAIRDVQGQLSGIVYSAENMEPLPGVSLFVKGTETGTVSGVDGSFSLNAGDDSGSTLVANFIGMQTEEIPIEAGRPLEIAMVPDHVQLDEVVVVGHAVSKKTSMASAVSRVETEPVTQNEYISASPVDGITAYREYIDTTLVYPAETESSDKAVVVLKFSVTPDGRPENFRVIRSAGDTFSQEAIRVISEGPDWKPTTNNGTYVDEEVRLRIVFRTDK